MSAALRLSLKSGERIYINGAVLKSDRRVCLELLNNATFLLEHHIMQPDGTTSPLRQLYFMVQSAVMEPATSYATTVLIEHTLEVQKKVFSNAEILGGLDAIAHSVGKGRFVDALKTLRKLIPIEAQILSVVAPNPNEPDVEEQSAACK